MTAEQLAASIMEHTRGGVWNGPAIMRLIQTAFDEAAGEMREWCAALAEALPEDPSHGMSGGLMRAAQISSCRYLADTIRALPPGAAVERPPSTPGVPFDNPTWNRAFEAHNACDDGPIDALAAAFEVVERETMERPEVVAQLQRIKDRIDMRMNDHLCDMKPDYDDSITGFNEAWTIARDTFAEALAIAGGGNG